MNDRRDQKISPLKVAAVILLIVFLVTTGLLIVSVTDKCSREEVPTVNLSEGRDVIEKNGVTYTIKDDVETVMFLGLDKYSSDEYSESFNNDRQADFVLLLVIDNEAETWSAIQINRDTMTEVNVLGVAGDVIDTNTEQIALAHTYGNGRMVSCRNVADAVTALLNVNVDHYISMTMDAVSAYNDLVGGVTLEVLDDFTGIDDTLVKGETVTLGSHNVLNYIRSRQGMEDSTNVRRMERQQQFMDALYHKTMECVESDDSFILNAATTMADSSKKYIVTDCTVDRLQYIGEKVSSYTHTDIYTLEGDSVAGERFMEFYADEEKTEDLVLKLFYNKSE